jgi:hypothetical protein
VKRSIFFLAIFYLSAQVEVLAVYTPLRETKQLIRKQHVFHRPKKTTACRIMTAKVAVADYELVQRDFEFTQSMTHQEIDLWLLKSAGFLAKSQIRKGEKHGANSKVSADLKNCVSALRPEAYGRALVFQVERGLIDAKGAGAEDPRPGDHKNGLSSLAENIREFAFEKLVRKVFDHYREVHSDSRLHTIGSYAVIDLGFDVKVLRKRKQETQYRAYPASMILRQAHFRHLAHSVKQKHKKTVFMQVEDQLAEEAERVLRLYGLTSGGEHFFSFGDIDVANIQGTEGGGIVDFGAFIAVAQFRKPVITYPSISAGSEAPIFLDPRRDSFVQPDPTVRVSLSFWGYSTRRGKVIRHDWKWADDWAKKLNGGEKTGSDFLEYLQQGLVLGQEVEN